MIRGRCYARWVSEAVALPGVTRAIGRVLSPLQATRYSVRDPRTPWRTRWDFSTGCSARSPARRRPFRRTPTRGRATRRPRRPRQPPRSEDEIAVERYRYLLRTAPPQTIEQVHAEAFAKLSPDQRQTVLAELKAGLPPAEQPQSSDPQTLARAATRAEYMQPGFMERTMQRSGGFGSSMGGSIVGHRRSATSSGRRS